MGQGPLQTLERRRDRERNKDKRANAGEFKANAQTARDLLFTYPAELSQAGRLNAARIVARYLVSTSAVAVDFNIHQPGKDGDEQNHHCHMMFTTRRMTAKGFGEKAREWDDIKTGPKLSKALRKFIADTINAELAAEGKAHLVKVEYLSFKARGMPQKPVQQHQGPGKTHALRKTAGACPHRMGGAAQRQGAARAPRQGAGFPETPAGFRATAQNGRDRAARQRGQGRDPARP